LTLYAAGFDPRRIKAARAILRSIAQRLDRNGDAQERTEQRK
jgi:hypothetical protein